MAIDTMNKFLVASQGDSIKILRPVMHLTADEALLLAAYLVLLAEPLATYEFGAVLEAVQNA